MSRPGALVPRPLTTTGVSFLPIQSAIVALSTSDVRVQSAEGRSLVGVANSTLQLRKGFLDADWDSFAAGVAAIGATDIGACVCLSACLLVCLSACL